MLSEQKAATPTLSLPAGGRTIRANSASVGEVGAGGTATFGLPLPISAGRGYAPGLGIGYNSAGGNSPFGIGWDMAVPSFSRRTRRGVPLYSGADEIVGPNGEMLVPMIGADGTAESYNTESYGDLPLSGSYTVSVFRSEVEGSFDRIEHWLGADPDGFWLVHAANGELHCFGKTAVARITGPVDAGTGTAVWLLQESVSPSGEHIAYQYREEMADGVAAADIEARRDHAAQRYLAEVVYGNRQYAKHLYAWTDNAPDDWMCRLVFDYGERTHGLDGPPDLATGSPWPVRQDPYSSFAYGFEVRTYRLCRQVLMFHYFPADLGDAPVLVSSLALEYDENPVAARLTGARQFAYGEDGQRADLPPVTFTYTPFELRADQPFQPFAPGMPGLDDGRFQMVDLFGDGIPGILNRDGGTWRYRAPERGTAGDEVAYGPWQTLPRVPAPRGNGAPAALFDCTGDGRPDWVVAAPGVRGFFTLNPDKSWSNFVPFEALPIELFAPDAQFGDFAGQGLTDLALIGPKSVRLYASRRDKGFERGADVAHADLPALPLAGRDWRELVGLSDVLGSGQAHLIRIRHDALTCWPNLGHGRFGHGFVFAALPFDAVSFDPARLQLVDLDGSGAASLVYARSDRVTILMNRGGNGFAEPVDMPLPRGVRYDDTCTLSFADVGGLGLASLILSVPHPTPRHWRVDFAARKPYLLASINNNMGAATDLVYRSSAQAWLDEKQADPRAVSSLPFPVQLASEIVQTDEITGNRLSARYRFMGGVYDGARREYRGFRYVEHRDTELTAPPGASDNGRANGRDDADYMPTVLTRNWFHTGEAVDVSPLTPAPYADPAARPLGATWITEYRADGDVDYQAATAERDTCGHALTGNVLRTETYGLDGSASEAVPYDTTEYRYQVRVVQRQGGKRCTVVACLPLEQKTTRYERVAVDPVTARQAVLSRDALGFATRSVAIAYPRRARPATNPYPATLPQTLWDSSYDTQQAVLRLAETRATYHHLQDPTAWRLGLAGAERQDHVIHDAPPANYEERLDVEALRRPDGLLGDPARRTLGGYETVTYCGDAGMPDFLAQVDHVSSAEFDDTALRAYDEGTEADAIVQQLIDAGYVRCALTLGDAAQTVWCVESGFGDYADASGFFRPLVLRSTRLASAINLTYDADWCVVTGTVDGLGNAVQALYDYRFLAPCRVIDINDNTREVLFDPLGRVIATSFHGTEEGETTGFAPVDEYAPIQLSTFEAIDAPQSALQDAACAYFYDPHSWRNTTPPVPPHSVALSADNYSRVPGRQIRIAITYGDGFGRALQSKGKVPPGLAYHADANGEVALGSDQRPMEAQAGSRWAVSGRVEYNNKGLAVRAYQPYFIDTPRYVADASVRQWGYADTHYYDALGREVRTTTAKGYLRRQAYFPWFIVAEDENDTLGEVPTARKAA